MSCTILRNTPPSRPDIFIGGRKIERKIYSRTYTPTRWRAVLVQTLATHVARTRARFSSRVIDLDGDPAERGDPSKFSGRNKTPVTNRSPTARRKRRK